MSIARVEGNPESLILLNDSELDGAVLEEQLRASLAQRTKLPPLASAHGRNQLADERRRLLQTIAELQERILDCGLVDTHRAGFLGKIELFVKRSMRKVVFRHLLQQHRVHLRLLTLLNQLVRYLEEQDQLLRVCIDRADRQAFEASFASSDEGPRHRKPK